VVAATAAAEAGESVFTAAIMRSGAHIASPIPRFVRVEVVKPLFPATRHWSGVTMMRVKAVVHVAIEPVRAVEPGASPEKHPADKPVGSVVAVRCAVIGSVIEVPVGAHGRHPDFDGNLGWTQGRTAEQCDGEN
jgi:hypothetical protein